MQIRNCIFLLSFLFSLFANSQTPFCVDSLRIRYGAYCAPDFTPVCGCDGITYRNLCFADINGLINYNPGICENIAIDINPNPTIDNIYINIIVKYQGDVDLFIYNHFGKLYLFRQFVYITDVYYPLNIASFDAGPYIVVARTNDDWVTKKIIKQDL